jgi:hypothetical protein
VLQRQQSTVPVEALRATLAHRLNHSTTDGPASTAADTTMIRPKPHPRPEPGATQPHTFSHHGATATLDR